MSFLDDNDEYDDFYDIPDDWDDEEEDVVDVIRLWRVEGILRPEPGRLGSGFTHITLARSRNEAEHKAYLKYPPIVQITRSFAVN